MTQVVSRFNGADLRQPEVDDLDDLVVGRARRTVIARHRRPRALQDDVGRFQIAMDDAAIVGRFQRIDDLSRDRERFVDRKQPV